MFEVPILSSRETWHHNSSIIQRNSLYCIGQRLGITFYEQGDRQIELTPERTSRFRSRLLTLEKWLRRALSTHDLPYLLPLVQPFSGAIISKPYPIELFTGLSCPNMMDTIIVPGKKSRVVILTQLRPNIEKCLDKLRKDIRSMYKAAERERKLQRYRERQHCEQNVNFSIANSVRATIARYEKLCANKMRVMWVGPYHVIGSAVYYFTVKHLVNGGEMDVHPSRLKFYSDDSLNASEELLNHIASQGAPLAAEAIV
ncbi:LOW QUALITY PROTEIN: Hypothetical protein PHPALM_11505 [Phytophthora palmivora]|uniref:Uncharacterized protein n=1 Tax=Phytophthora palmivora TaxID=4796 RepID=A0A2P4Y236_9STRA|nr:LOW QUALITY PROTEIN: Hypothetical protein PHPALM_11505 [Phytophthora palmivora]